ncbi:MAG: cysteine hydrolase [Bifidobacterium sp.]|nr:cysteine hydrolase [Bifidobacterium sp.]
MIRDDEWLVVVDRQQVFAQSDWSTWAVPDGAFYTTDGPYSRLADAFGERALYTKYVSPVPPTGSWVDYFKDWPDFEVSPDDPMFDFTPDTAERAEGHPVVVRDVFSKWCPEMQAIVGAGGWMTVCGVATDFCVLQTCLAAADDGMHVRVASDACAGTSPENHQRALDLMALYAPLITVEDTSSILQ